MIDSRSPVSIFAVDEIKQIVRDMMKVEVIRILMGNQSISWDIYTLQLTSG